MRGFHRIPQGVTAEFDVMQAGVLRRLATDIEDLMVQRSQDENPGAGHPSVDGTQDPLEALFADFTAGATDRPDDPVLARLLPDGYTGPAPGEAAHVNDPNFDLASAAADFRRFTESDLRNGKTANARLIRGSLPPAGGDVLLDDEQAACWLSGLNDMRLALGTTLEVGPDTEREYARLDPLSSRARRLYLYFWLGVLQETLLDAISAN
jgi:hypothetical protein